MSGITGLVALTSSSHALASFLLRLQQKQRRAMRMPEQNPEYWLAKAAEVYSVAEELQDPRARLVLMEIALKYQQLAKAARADGGTYSGDAAREHSTNQRPS